jgi:hypothetical protein
MQSEQQLHVPPAPRQLIMMSADRLVLHDLPVFELLVNGFHFTPFLGSKSHCYARQVNGEFRYSLWFSTTDYAEVTLMVHEP